MPESDRFIEVARAHGFSAEAAAAALATLQARLAERGVQTRRFYGYRTTGGASGASEGGREAPRPRLLLVFPSADAALGFAQRHRLGRSPRLVALSLSQALAALLQRPAIQALLIADEQAEEAAPGLPPGLRLERKALLDLLR
ncbi:MAG: hypothetical protein RMK84_01800 [Oscillochloridaceae bacterium]|nr:hypothetical protein [Chloroflexaceae bacterium]MDW8388835.1 hypothetical protein [Oscillochloridaceae bacterium]